MSNHRIDVTACDEWIGITDPLLGDSALVIPARMSDIRDILAANPYEPLEAAYPYEHPFALL